MLVHVDRANCGGINHRGALVVLQVLQWVLSYDGENQTEGLAITAASAALAMSGRGTSCSAYYAITRLLALLKLHGCGI